MHFRKHLLDHHRLPVLRLKRGLLNVKDRTVKEEVTTEKRSLSAHQGRPRGRKVHPHSQKSHIAKTQHPQPWRYPQYCPPISYRLPLRASISSRNPHFKIFRTPDLDPQNRQRRVLLSAAGPRNSPNKISQIIRLRDAGERSDKLVSLEGAREGETTSLRVLLHPRQRNHRQMQGKIFLI